MVRTKNSSTKSANKCPPWFPVKRDIAKPRRRLHIRHTSSSATPWADPRRRLAPLHLPPLIHQETKEHHYPQWSLVVSLTLASSVLIVLRTSSWGRWRIYNKTELMLSDSSLLGQAMEFNVLWESLLIAYPKMGLFKVRSCLRLFFTVEKVNVWRVVRCLVKIQRLNARGSQRTCCNKWQGVMLVAVGRSLLIFCLPIASLICPSCGPAPV